MADLVRWLQLRLTVTQWADLERYAKENGWTLHDQVEFVLRTYEPPQEVADDE
jgi:hypothetical protein